jgi:hypothetical protein
MRTVSEPEFVNLLRIDFKVDFLTYIKKEWADFPFLSWCLYCYTIPNSVHRIEDFSIYEVILRGVIQNFEHRGRRQDRGLFLVGVLPKARGGKPWPVQWLKLWKAELTGCSSRGCSEAASFLSTPPAAWYKGFLLKQFSSLKSRIACEAIIYTEFLVLKASGILYLLLTRVNIQWCTSTIHAVSQFLSTW